VRKTLLLFAAMHLPWGWSQATEIQVDKSQKNLVRFISDAPIEDFDGTTNKIDGYAIWEGNEPLQKSEIYLEVDLASIDTGIGLRNRHMREHYLETDKYPRAEYSGKLTKAEKQSDTVYKVATEGKMTIHGVENPFAAEGTVTVDGMLFRVQVSFPIKLSDYKIKIPKIMFYKIDETMDLQLNFYLRQTKEQ